MDRRTTDKDRDWLGSLLAWLLLAAIAYMDYRLAVVLIDLLW